jgi:hypothetical protein
MHPSTWDLLSLFLLAVSALLIADYLARQARIRRVRRRRLELRINEVKRDAHRLRERPTLNTRGRAP